MLVSGWSDGPGYPDVILGIPVNFVRLRRDFGPRGPKAHGGPDSIRGPPENPKGGVGAPSALPLATSLSMTLSILKSAGDISPGGFRERGMDTRPPVGDAPDTDHIFI